MMIKLIAIDMDGTALNSNHEFSPRLFHLLKKAIQQGVHVIPATGRTLTTIPREVFRIPGIRYVISSNGADIMDLYTKKSIKKELLPGKEALAVLERLKRFPIICYIHSEGRQYQSKDSIEFRLEYDPHFKSFLTPNLIDNLGDFILTHPDEIEKVGGICYDEEIFQAILQEEKKFGHINMASTGKLSIEFNSPHASKGNALDYLCSILKIPSSQVMALGDNQNDLSMFQFAGHAVAMGNAIDELKELADEITLSCDEDGAAIAIEKIL